MASEHTDTQDNRRKVNYSDLMRIGKELLVAIGEDPDSNGLADTPRRFADYWKEFIEYDAGNTGVTFETFSADQIVVVNGMRVWSVCEHHLLPFWCDVSIGYLANGKVLGLSKFARIAHQFAHRPQLQERLVQQIADEVTRLTGTKDVAVVARGVHLCMVMRGIRTEGQMITSVMNGIFRQSTSIRAEFLKLVELSNGWSK